MNLDIYRKAVETFGEEKQIDIAIEELSELIQALCKHKRYGHSNSEEEIADVKIALKQLERMDSFDSKAVKGWEIIKEDRLKKLIDKSCS